MLVYGRRRCCAGVYMLDAANFESIVAELKSEDTCLKTRSRGQNINGVNHVNSGAKTQNEARSNGSSTTSSRKNHITETPLKQGVLKSEKTHVSSRKNFSQSEFSPKRQSNYTEDKVKPELHRHRTYSEQPSSDIRHKTRDVLNNRRSYSSLNNIHRNSVRRASESDSCNESVHWIKNNLTDVPSYEEASTDCKACNKDFNSCTTVSEIASSNSLTVHDSNAFIGPPIVCSNNGASNLHSLIHYTTGQPILLYDYSEDNCPICQKSRKRRLRVGNAHQNGDSASQRRIAQCSNHSQISHFSKSDNHPHIHHRQSCTSSTPVKPADCLEISGKSFTHPHLNLTCCSKYDVNSRSGHQVQDGGLVYPDNELGDTIPHPNASIQTTKSSGSCCICSQPRCSQCTWSQFFYDSYYHIYYMYPQQTPIGMNNSVFLDLTNKSFTLTIERPYLDESEVRNLLKSVNHGHSTSLGESSYCQSRKDGDKYEDKGPSTAWSAGHKQRSFPSGPIVCVSMPNMEKLRYTNTSLVPPQSFLDYCGSAPPERLWRPLCEPVQGAIQFTLMCYNILCEKYASQQVYPYCPSWALNWVYRRTAILDEIRLYTADIICLQEVEMDQYELHFEKLLKTQGYSGIFSPKSRAHHMTDAERRKVDGCAIFWKNERFRLVKDTVIEFSRMAMERYENDCKESPEMLNRVMVRDNIALSAILETKESSQPQQFMVSTAHIHWDPEYSDVKLIQSIMHVSSLNQKIEEHLLEQNGGKTPVYPSNMPLIVCGDFNSLPQSGVVEFLTQGRVAKSHPDFKNLGYVKVLDKLCGRRRHNRNNAGEDVLQHDFVLGRAYDGGEGMRYTNYTYDFKGIIDYIFYSKNHFNILGNLEMVSEDWLKKEKIPGCPHPHIPSDHFPLLVELELQLPGDHHSHSRK